MERFFNKTHPTETGCLEWAASVSNSGYGTFSFNGKTDTAHRVAWRLEYGDIPDGKHVCHTCDNRKCVNFEHLFLGSRSDNMQDMLAKGRWRAAPVAGDSHPNVKITEDMVAAIKSSDEPTAKIAKDLGVSYQAVWQIRTGKRR